MSDEFKIGPTHLRAIAQELQVDKDFANGLRLVAPQTGVNITLPTQHFLSFEHNFLAEGLKRMEDVLPLLYYWMQTQLRKQLKKKSSLNLSVLQSMPGIFKKIASRYNKEWNFLEPHSAHHSVPLEDLIQHLSYQIEYGLRIFNMEAMTASLGKYWAAKASDLQPYEVSQRYTKTVTEMWSALEALSYGDDDIMVPLTVSFSHKTIANEHSKSRGELMIIGALHNLAVAELMYRSATCDTDAMMRNEQLTKAQIHADDSFNVMFNHFNPSTVYAGFVHPIVKYNGYLKSAISDALRAGTEKGPAQMVGTMIQGYGPTSASVILRSGIPCILPLTPIGPVV